jgi:monoamine oxidase
LKYDISVQQFFDQYLYEEKHQQLRASLQKYVEGYYAAELTQVSTFALRDEMENSSDAQYGIEGGYTLLLGYLQKQLAQNNCDIILSSPAKKIEWRKGYVSVQTNNETYNAEKILITVSMGVLQSETLKFQPAIEDKINAAKHVGFGHVIKIVLQFEKAFWKEKDELQKMSFLFSEETIPTWWTTYPKESNTLVGWLGGPNAKACKDASEEDVVDKAIYSLSNIFSIDVVHLQQMLIASHAFNWSNDPFTLGAYSFDVVNGYKYKQIIRGPIANTVFFAGEGLHDGPEIGTVEAALQTGRKAAQEILRAGKA